MLWTAPSEFCELCFFLIIDGISSCLLQFFLQLLNGLLIHLLCLATLDSEIHTLNDCEKISTSVDGRDGNLGLFCDCWNRDFVGFHPTMKLDLDHHAPPPSLLCVRVMEGWDALKNEYRGTFSDQLPPHRSAALCGESKERRAASRTSTLETRSAYGSDGGTTSTRRCASASWTRCAWSR